MNLLRVILILIIAVVVLAVVVVRRATANFKRLRMGCFFDLEARDHALSPTHSPTPTPTHSHPPTPPHP
jgi:hypothetical protein